MTPMTYHIRVGIKPAGRRITDRGNAGQTLCGAPITSDDCSIREARTIVGEGWTHPRAQRCEKCFNKLMGIDFKRGARAED